MKFNLNKVEFSKNDLRKGIKIPTKLTKELAHFIGIHMGDGHLSKRKNGYRICYSGHWINELNWYQNYLFVLIKNLFNKEVGPVKGHDCVQININSKAIHFFFSKVCDLPVGSKSNCDFLKFIKNGYLSIKKAFLRGFADTDFSLVFKNRHKNINYYPVIDCAISNKVLRDSLVNLIESIGFKVYSNERLRKRKNKVNASYYFQINGVKAIEKWMKEVGFTSYNQLTKYWLWKKQGFVPSKTNINYRLEVLKISLIK